MKERSNKKIYISKKGEKTLNLGHPWVYYGEIEKRDNNIENGEIIDITNDAGKYLGSGFYNDNSKITVRLLSKNANDLFDDAFFKRRINYALQYRLNSMGKENLNSFRVIFGEADEMPGLTVDKMNDILVVQILSLGIEKRKESILKSLYEVMIENGFTIHGIYIRNDVNIREKEGLTEYKCWFDLGVEHPTTTKTIIEENGIKYEVDFENGQKTGFFLDQKFNRMLVRRIAEGKTILDCCTHTGSFAMNAYAGGAKKVVASDISAKALEDAKHNFELNNMNIETIEADVFDLLKDLNSKSNKEQYDFIILDPPAFTKSRKTIDQALKGYQEINYLAMKALPRGGFLATASCSHFASEERFKEAIYKASIQANVHLKLVSQTGPAPDHPELLGVEETKYLKFFIFQVF